MNAVGRSVGIVTVAAGFRVENRPNGEACEFPYFGAALRRAVRWSADLGHAPVANDTGIEPLTGNLGPIRWVQHARVWVVPCEAGSEVFLHPSVWGSALPPQTFTGPNHADAALTYGRQVLAFVRKSAQAAQDRHERNQRLKMDERIRLATGGANDR